MALTILSVAYPFAAVRPDTVGGAEQILSCLDRALVRAGHRSVVVGRADSECAGTLVPTPMPGDAIITDDVRRRVHAVHRANVLRALDRFGPDVVHMHGVDFLEYLPPAGIPVLATLHLPPSWYPPGLFGLERPGTFVQCVSRAQRRACPAVGGALRMLPEIENGVAVGALAMRCGKRRYAVALGRICPEKNQHAALEAGQIAAMGVLIGGAVFPYAAHRNYFAERIAPRLDGKRRFLGPLKVRRKRRLLSGARCLLHPTLAPETSSLVAMEALACGTPVVAFPSGALPEIVRPGVTGYLVRDVREMAAAAEAAGDLDAEACREEARRRFSLEAMVRRYFEAYRKVACGELGARRFCGGDVQGVVTR